MNFASTNPPLLTLDNSSILIDEGSASLAPDLNPSFTTSRSRALPSLEITSLELGSKLKETITGKQQRIVGTAENDVLDASKGKGNNTLVGKKGNDRLKGKREDKLMGGPGNDRLDTRKGRKNTLKGGGGNDRLFVGKKDKASGGGGADTLNALKGKGNNLLKGGGGDDVLIGLKGDRLVGGGGDDEFVLVKGKLPQKALIVQDFQKGRDRLSIQNFPDATVLSDLTLTQQNTDTLISIQGQSVAILENITATQLTSDDIDGIAPTPTTPTPTTPTPSPIQISIADDEVFEGNPGDNNQVTFVVSLSRPADQDVTVTYQTVSVTNGATPNTDYLPTQGTLIIPAGATARPIDVQIIEDLKDEDNERVVLELLSVNGAEIVDGRAIGLIKDDEDEVVKTQKSNQYSTTGTDETNIRYQYEMTITDDNGEEIVDLFGNDSNTGLFPGAIRNYESGSGSLKSTGSETLFSFNPNGDTSLATANLKAEFIDNPDPETDEIEYSIIAIGSSEPELIFRDTVSAFPVASGDPIDINQAINSLTYIVNEDLINDGFFDTDFDLFGDDFIGNYSTREIKKYSQSRIDSSGTSSIIQEISTVDRTDEDFDDGDVGTTFIDDSNASIDSGYFIGAIEQYSNADTGQAFSQGNLATERNGSVVTYTISSASNAISITAELDLSSTSFDLSEAVNNLEYILDNDLIRVAFFE